MSNNVKSLNTKLLGLAGILLLLSAFTYHQSVTRAERFERGQKFLPNLNPDDIAEIDVLKGTERTVLERGDGQFVLPSSQGYPAKNEAVNRFIRDVLKLSLDKEVGEGDKLAKELELTPDGPALPENSMEVAFKNNAGDDMVRFRVGKAADGEGASGSYVQRVDVADQPIYLTESRVYLSTDEASFLDKEILDVKAEEVAAVRAAGWAIERQEDELALVDMPGGKKTSSKFNQATGLLSLLRFEQHYLANDPTVAGVRFDTEIEVELNNQSAYKLTVGSLGEKHYLVIDGYSNADPVEITMDTPEEEVREKSEILAAADELDAFRAFHGSWIYEISESTAEKIRLQKSDLYEDA